jgi:hypothetical protein
MPEETKTYMVVELFNNDEQRCAWITSDDLAGFIRDIRSYSSGRVQIYEVGPCVFDTESMENLL